MVQAHLESIASLVIEGTREAAAATAVVYELSEEHLSTAARLFAMARGTGAGAVAPVSGGAWRTRLIIAADGKVHGDWGPIPNRSREAFLDRMERAGRGEMVDDSVPRSYGLQCVRERHPLDDRMMTVICRDAATFDRLRREIGIGPLMKGLVKRDVLYVALQDETGILAVAPSAELLSAWNRDGELGSALQGGHRTHRIRHAGGRTVFEGLTPFEMADGTTALLRVGVDATTLDTLKRNTSRRYGIMVALVASVVTLVSILTWLYSAWRAHRAQNERALAEQERQRRHWETIGQMAGTVAHEIRNPLNTVGMVAQRLGREFAVPAAEKAEFSELVDLLRSESDRVNRVVTEFLELGRPLALERRSIGADRAVIDAVAPLRLRAEREGVRLELEDRCEGDVEVDVTRFRQMMTNLVENALDAVSAGGTITVRSSCGPDGLQVEVADDGAGIDQTRIEAVLEPFVSFKSRGTGLGLPLVKRLAEAHGGTFTIESNAGRGTTARVFIPTMTTRSSKRDDSHAGRDTAGRG